MSQPPQMIPFTSNFEDHSTDFGYQFEFFCQRCGNGYESSFQKSATGIGGGFLRAAGGLFGGVLGTMSSANDSLSDLVRGPARDRALSTAVEEMRPHFMQCHRCGEWVCKEICWNGDTKLCTRCSPKIQQEIGALQIETQVQQIQAKLTNIDLTKGLDITTQKPALCPSCGAETKGGKFCNNCGAPLVTALRCPNCQAENVAGSKFCNECGTRLG